MNLSGTTPLMKKSAQRAGNLTEEGGPYLRLPKSGYLPQAKFLCMVGGGL